MVKPFEVLGKFYPTYLGNRIFKDRLCIWSDHRDTEDNIFTAGLDGVCNWHKDDGGMKEHIVLWSDSYPTEIRLEDGSIVRGEPYDVVLIDNAVVSHRVPNDYVMAVKQGRRPERRFIRQTMVKYLTDEQIDNLKRQLVSS